MRTINKGQCLAPNHFRGIFFNPLRDELYDYSCVLFKQITWHIKKTISLSTQILTTILIPIDVAICHWCTIKWC